MLLGDRLESALEIVGITQERVTAWLGDCCCDERKAKLNDLDIWARRTLANKYRDAKRWLERILDE